MNDKINNLLSKLNKAIYRSINSRNILKFVHYNTNVKHLKNLSAFIDIKLKKNTILNNNNNSPETYSGGSNLY